MILQIGPLTIDFTPLLDAAAVSPFSAIWYITVHGGWILFAWVILRGFWWLWREHIGIKAHHEYKWVVLAIDVPKENIQTPRAVENILAHLAGAHDKPDFVEKYFAGHFQPYFSLEIVSVGGSIRFYVYTTTKNRDLVEASIYAQYPTAQITEAEDYTKDAPSYFPDPDYQLWGVEFIPPKSAVYPIRTYIDFQDKVAEEESFKDPMAALLETFSSLKAGEQLWFQIIIVPISSGSWQEHSHHEVNKLVKAEEEHHASFFQKIVGLPGDFILGIFHLLTSGGEAEEQRRKEPNQILYLTTVQREVVDAIERKAAKIGFATKIRCLYLAKKEVFHKARAGYGVIGAIKQVNTENAGALKPEYDTVGTSAHYYLSDLRKNWRRVKIMRSYKARDWEAGMHTFVLNIEELATLWHFPVTAAVKAPLIKKVESKRYEPPIELPVDVLTPRSNLGSKTISAGLRKNAPPEGLPTEEGEEPPGNLPI